MARRLHLLYVVRPSERERQENFTFVLDDSFLAFSVGCTCKNGGRCMMGLGTYICECPYGYNGLNCETSEFLVE